MLLSTDPRQGARKIVELCLDLTAGQELLILFDETTSEVANLLLEAASQLDVFSTAIYVPVALQRQIGKSKRLPLATEAAIHGANGIITSLTDAQDCMLFRKEIIRLGLDRWTKIGHMPGANLQTLAMADADYREIENLCQLLALVLLRGKSLRLASTDRLGIEHGLDVEIGGWERPPVISSGIIKPGSWGNIPPGETFLAPMEGTAHGSLVINGSLPGYVLSENSEVILEFERGCLVSYTSPDAHCLEIIDGLKAFAEAQGDPNWCNLAEIGVGVNQAIHALTGIELVDEKKLGTAHIALGENKTFGGNVTSAIHSDLITCSPTLEVDGQAVIRQGGLVTQLIDWQINHHELDASQERVNSLHSLSPSSIEVNTHNHTFLRQWKDGRGEAGWLQVGHPDSNHKAGRIYQLIKRMENRNHEQGVDLAYLASRSPDMGEEEIRQLVLLLWEYELIVIS